MSHKLHIYIIVIQKKKLQAEFNYWNWLDIKLQHDHIKHIIAKPL